MSEKTPGQVAWEGYYNGTPNIPWDNVVVQDGWEAAATAARADLVAEVERLNAELAAWRGGAAAWRGGAEEPRWVAMGGAMGGMHVLEAYRRIVVAEVLVDPNSMGWTAGGHNGRVNAQGPDALDLAKRLAELAAGVAR